MDARSQNRRDHRYRIESGYFRIDSIPGAGSEVFKKVATDLRVVIERYNRSDIVHNLSVVTSIIMAARRSAATKTSNETTNKSGSLTSLERSTRSEQKTRTCGHYSSKFPNQLFNPATIDSAYLRSPVNAS